MNTDDSYFEDPSFLSVWGRRQKATGGKKARVERSNRGDYGGLLTGNIHGKNRGDAGGLRGNAHHHTSEKKISLPLITSSVLYAQGEENQSSL